MRRFGEFAALDDVDDLRCNRVDVLGCGECLCVYEANVVDATLWEESARRGMPNGAGPQPGGEHGDGDDIVGRPDGGDGDCRLRPDDHLSLRLLA